MAPPRSAAACCASYVVAADDAASGLHDGAVDRFALTEEALVLLTHAEHFDSVVDRSRELLGAAPEGRLSMAWQIVDDALKTLETTRHEWVDADPATVAAAGWVLVDRMGRLLIAAALVAEAARGGPAAATELLVNAARRYAWNHLRGPAPEAATANPRATIRRPRCARFCPGTFVTTSALQRLGRVLLPSSPAGRTLAIGAGIDSLGTGMFFASFALYFVGVVGIAATEVALAATIAGAVALLAPVPLGRLADRLGTGRFYVALLLLRGLGYGCFAFVTDFKGFLLLTVLLTAADRSSSPIQQAVVTAVIGGQDRTRTMASIRAVRNIGLTVGFLLAGAAFAAAQPSVFIAIFVSNGLSFVVVAVMVRRVLTKAGAVVERPAPAATTASAAGVRSPFRDRWFMVFTVGNGEDHEPPIAEWGSDTRGGCGRRSGCGAFYDRPAFDSTRRTMTATTTKESPLLTKIAMNTDGCAAAKAAPARRKPTVRPMLRTARMEAIVRVRSWPPITAVTTACWIGELDRSAAVSNTVSKRKPLKSVTNAKQP